VLALLRRHPARLLRLWALPLQLLDFARTRDHGRLKARVLRAVLSGLPRAQAEREAAAFLAGLGTEQLRPGALDALDVHRAAGHRLVLMSASPDLYVRGLAARLGFDEAICTELRWDDGQFSGEFATPNRRGAERRRCLEALRRSHPGARLAAYGNAASDLDHLAAVEEPHLVNAHPDARRRADALGIPTLDWP